MHAIDTLSMMFEAYGGSKCVSFSFSWIHSFWSSFDQWIEHFKVRTHEHQHAYIDYVHVYTRIVIVNVWREEKTETNRTNI